MAEMLPVSVEAARDAGAVSAHYVVLRLPWEVNPLFQQWLEVHFPERDMRGGKEYDSDFSKRMSGEGVWATLFDSVSSRRCSGWA
nr:hypothetical protein [Massilia frigida]